MYFFIFLTPEGLAICTKSMSFNDSLKSNISLSISSLVAPNNILFNIPSKNSLNNGGKFDF